METFLIWLGFGLGLLVRWGDRIQFVIAEDTSHTLIGYVKNNYIRLVIRLVSNAAVFYYVVLPTGWVIAPPVAFSIGLSFDTMAESFLDRAKKHGESFLNKANGKG